MTDNDKGLLDGRRIAEYAYALPRTRWNAGVESAYTLCTNAQRSPVRHGWTWRPAG